MLTAGMMESREIKLMYALLTRYNYDPDDFHFRSVICDGTQLYRSIPENKQEATECTHHILARTDQFQISRFCMWLMALRFEKAKVRFLYIHYLLHGTTINWKHDDSLLKRLRQLVKYSDFHLFPKLKNNFAWNKVQ